jgi:hypothetical protein
LQKEIQERRKCYGKAQEHYKIVQQEADIKILQRAKIIGVLYGKCDIINLSKREMFILFCLAVS